MIKLTTEDLIHNLRLKRDKMIQAQEKGLEIDFGMTLADVVNEIAELSAELDKEFKAERFPMSDDFDEQLERNPILDAGLSLLPLKAIS